MSLCVCNVVFTFHVNIHSCSTYIAIALPIHLNICCTELQIKNINKRIYSNLHVFILQIYVAVFSPLNILHDKTELGLPATLQKI